jgi:hypothetical protein
MFKALSMQLCKFYINFIIFCVTGEEFQIQRGTWFYEGTWQPVEYPHSEHIESIHLQLFCGHRLADYVTPSSSKTQRAGMTIIQNPGYSLKLNYLKNIDILVICKYLNRQD